MNSVFEKLRQAGHGGTNRKLKSENERGREDGEKRRKMREGKEEGAWRKHAERSWGQGVESRTPKKEEERTCDRKKGGGIHVVRADDFQKQGHLGVHAAVTLRWVQGPRAEEWWAQSAPGEGRPSGC